MCKLFNLHKTNKYFTTDVNSCSTEKNIKFNKFKKESMYLNKTQVTEKTLVNNPSESKFLCLKHKLYNFSLEFIFKCVKQKKKMEKFRNLLNNLVALLFQLVSFNKSTIY